MACSCCFCFLGNFSLSVGASAYSCRCTNSQQNVCVTWWKELKYLQQRFSVAPCLAVVLKCTCPGKQSSKKCHLIQSSHSWLSEILSFTTGDIPSVPQKHWPVENDFHFLVYSYSLKLQGVTFFKITLSMVPYFFICIVFSVDVKVMFQFAAQVL